MGSTGYTDAGADIDGVTSKKLQEVAAVVVERNKFEAEPTTFATIICKVKVNSVAKGTDPENPQETVYLSAVYSDDPASENAQWSKWTPAANFNLTISNPAALGKLIEGVEYFVEFKPAS